MMVFFATSHVEMKCIIHPTLSSLESVLAAFGCRPFPFPLSSFFLAFKTLLCFRFFQSRVGRTAVALNAAL